MSKSVNKVELMMRRLERERRLSSWQVKCPGAGFLIRDLERLIEQVKADLIDIGVTEDEYKSFVEANWFKFEVSDMHAEYMARCRHLLRFLSNAGDPGVGPDCISNWTCGLDCPDYDPVSAEDLDRWYAGEDI